MGLRIHTKQHGWRLIGFIRFPWAMENTSWELGLMPVLYNNSPMIIHNNNPIIIRTNNIRLVRGNPVFRASIVSPGETATFRASCVSPGVTPTFPALQSRPRKTPTFRAPHATTMCGGRRGSRASLTAGMALGNSLHDYYSLPCGPRPWYFSIPC